MPIIYTLISRGTTVLCEAAMQRGNFGQIARTIIQKIPQVNNKMSYIYEQYTFHYTISERITYLCLTDRAFYNGTAFSFLENVQQRFTSQYGGSVYSASSNAMSSFASELTNLMDSYSRNNPDKLQMVQDDVQALKGTMEENIDKILARQEKLEIMVDNSAQLADSATQFRKRSTQLKRTMWWKNCKLWLVIIAIILVVIFFIVLIACGGFSFSKCR